MEKYVTLFEDYEEVLKFLSQNSFMGVAILQDGIIKNVNDTFLRITGFTMEEITEWTINELFNFFHPDDLSILVDISRKGGFNYSVDLRNYIFRFITRNAETKRVLINSEIILYKEAPADLFVIVEIPSEII